MLFSSIINTDIVSLRLSANKIMLISKCEAGAACGDIKRCNKRNSKIFHKTILQVWCAFVHLVRGHEDKERIKVLEEETQTLKSNVLELNEMIKATKTINTNLKTKEQTHTAIFIV